MTTSKLCYMSIFITFYLFLKDQRQDLLEYQITLKKNFFFNANTFLNWNDRWLWMESHASLYSLIQFFFLFLLTPKMCKCFSTFCCMTQLWTTYLKHIKVLCVLSSRKPDIFGFKDLIFCSVSTVNKNKQIAKTKDSEFAQSSKFANSSKH